MSSRELLPTLVTLLLLGSIAMATPPKSGTDSSQLATANNDFALAMLRQLEQDEKTINPFFSPFSIQSALMMTMEGARGETALQMGQTLQFPERWKQKDPQSPWNLAPPRDQLRSVVSQIPNLDAPELATLRKSLAQLRKELDQANRTVDSLNNKRDFEGASKASKKSADLAEKIKQLAIQAEPYELRIANAIWIEQTMPLQPSFLEITRNFYGTQGARPSDFIKSAGQERQRINQWVASETKDKIRDLLSPGTIQSDTRMVLANAIYFLGTWRSPFDQVNTQPGDFHLASGDTISTPLMFQLYESGIRYGAFQGNGSFFDTPKMIPFDADSKVGYPGDDGFELVEIPYNGEGIAMSILLPRSRTGLAAMVSKLSAQSLAQWHEKLVDREATVTMPRFRMETKLDLNDTLKRMGLIAAFDGAPGAADFSGMTVRPDDRLFITNVIHQAMVDVNEKGTEAAAATAVTMATASAPIQRKFTPDFRADHPFLFMIRDTRNGMILFLGVYDKPVGN